jgi:predicted nucleic acid-binding protein
MSKVFVDTNVLVYSMDKFDPGKRSQCRALLTSFTGELRGVISTQVMQEFYVAATRRLGVDPLLAKDILHSFEHFEVVIVTPDMIRDAIDCSVINRVSFWDALIVVAAESASCERIWTEDLNHGQIIRGVRVENPLRLSETVGPS